MLTPHDVRNHMARGAMVLDVRPPEQFVKLHLAGAVPVPGPRFGMSYLLQGTFEPGQRTLLVAEDAIAGFVAAQEAVALGLEVIGVFTALPRTWENRGLPVVHGILVLPETLRAFFQEHPEAELVDVREPIEQTQFPFPRVTRSVPFSQWPDGIDQLSRTDLVVTVSAGQERSVLAAMDLMRQGFAQVGFVVGGYQRYFHPRRYNPKEAARTTAHHGSLI